MAWEKQLTQYRTTTINSEVQFFFPETLTQFQTIALIRMNPNVRNHILLGVYFHDISIVVVFIPNFSHTWGSSHLVSGQQAWFVSPELGLFHL